MSLPDFIAAYNASTNAEAHIVCDFLIESGIQAHVTEDVSVVGLSMFGPLPEIHKPQVWVRREDLDLAGPLLADYERQQVERVNARRSKAANSSEKIEVVCEECGKTSHFPAALLGKVEDCPHCGAFVDVGDDGSQEWYEAENE